jgi:hypothetical protein
MTIYGQTLRFGSRAPMGEECGRRLNLIRRLVIPYADD